MFRDDIDAVSRMLGAKRVAVVGLSPDEGKPSYRVAKYLMEQGIEVIPVNPNYAEILGKKCYRSLKEVPAVAGGIDVVDVFRRPEHCLEVIRDAIAIRAKGVWLQSGIRCPDGKRLAERAGMDYVEDRCLMVEHAGRGMA
jgi:uncharacterized protein